MISTRQVIFKILNGLTGILAMYSQSYAQNTASASGNWSACPTWGNPPAIYRNTTDTKTINNGITVTADTNWSTAAIVLNGNGGVNYNSGVFTDLVNDQGADVTCDAVLAALASAGCSSCGAYNAAGAGQVVPITVNEYVAVRNRLTSMTQAGSSDDVMNGGGNWRFAYTGSQTTNTSQPSAPANSFIVAFSLAFYADVAPAYVKLKYNTTGSPTSGYADYESAAVTANTGTIGRFYYLIKTPNQRTYSGGPTFIAYYQNGSGLRTNGNDDAYVYNYADSNSGYTYQSASNVGCVQVVTTTVRQW